MAARRAWPKERLAGERRARDPDAVSEPAFDEDDKRLLFEVLFDLRALLDRLVASVEGGDDDGEEEEDDPDVP